MAVSPGVMDKPKRPLPENAPTRGGAAALPSTRDIVFISKATPGDDPFALWLAPKLEAAGYRVFADVLSLRAGESWRKRLTETLRDRAVKMLLCCSDATLQKAGVQEEIGIAQHVMIALLFRCASRTTRPSLVWPTRNSSTSRVAGPRASSICSRS